MKKVKKKFYWRNFLCRDRNELLPIYSVMLCTFNNPLFMLLSFFLASIFTYGWCHALPIICYWTCTVTNKYVRIFFSFFGDVTDIDVCGTIDYDFPYLFVYCQWQLFRLFCIIAIHHLNICSRFFFRQ